MDGNVPDPKYGEKLRLVAEVLKAVEGPIYIATHVDPDGDAIGSSLGLYRALKALGKEARWVAEPPRFLRFLAQEEEYTPPLERLPLGATLVVLDSADPSRVAGVPLEGFVVNIDHHGTNPRFGHLAVVDPSKAATAEMVKDLIDLLGVAWTEEIATPVLTGILTDTGNFRFGNTTPEVLRKAAELLASGVRLSEITDRLQYRSPAYFKALAAVLATLGFHYGGLLVTAHLPEGLDLPEEDADGFVGVIRYAEGAVVAAYLRRRGEGVKVSLRSRGGVSAQNIALRLGGGGHVPAAGATLEGVDLEEAYRRLLEAVAEELRRAGYL
ncbi:DHH family phosphoesterase [Thermus thermamylovorans]|uniref:Bifunctional oligoribonuclease/PAP phosphatase NrnA n=1 Tax=Thermus thermamylovorans TaxID=2509362 RepID=A0A4Q9B3P5_9DEIN|nr:bifunctional oligoribonuclease/PAP phosphatase NrnA [Thermus thermamylovorans]TBH20164.1 bifunctional oligoribonuclease/PAP phosphatase NrnA [Thermus thermamylovorans]